MSATTAPLPASNARRPHLARSAKQPLISKMEYAGPLVCLAILRAILPISASFALAPALPALPEPTARPASLLIL